MFEAASMRPSSAGSRFSTNKKPALAIVREDQGNIFLAAFLGGCANITSFRF